MKIKTITGRVNYPADFDRVVNEAQEEGWRLVKREVLPGTPGNPNSPRLLYAELVQLDPEPEPAAQPVDPIDAVYAIKATCDAVPIKDCQVGRCPLYAWCCQLRDAGDPTEWDLPKREAPEA